MAYLRQDDSTTVFSPSVARVAASTAKDWSYVDSWLSKLLPSQRLPEYERNSATLKALLTLAGINEAANDDRDLISTASKLALRDNAGAEIATNLTTGTCCENGLVIRNLIVAKVTNYLTREGKIALEALADTSVQHRIDFPIPEDLCKEFLNLQTSLFETEQVMTQVKALKEHLTRELQISAEHLALFQGPNYTLPTELSKQNLDLQRKTKLKSKQILDARECLNTPFSRPRLPCTIESVMREEQQLLGLLIERKTLDSQIAAFRRLPSDPERARDQLEGLQEQLRSLTAQRDHVFEGLVEQASPLKRR